MSHSPAAVADAAPPGAAPAFDVRTLTDEQAHAFGVAVASMSFAYDGLKAENAALRERIAQRDARIALQKQTIVQLRRTADADPDELLRRIGEVLGDGVGAPSPVQAPPRPYGTVLGAVRADWAGLNVPPRPAPATPGEAALDRPAESSHSTDADPDHDADPGCTCGVCPGPKPAPVAAAPASGRWWSWLRWSR